MRQAKKITNKATRKAIFDYVYQRADEHRYLAKDKNANGIFMSQLAADPNVGGKLGDFINKAEIHKYIKDTILNQYSKLRRRLPKDIKQILARQYVGQIHDITYVKKDHLSLHRIDDKYLVVARANYLKWETAIRKLSLYVAGSINVEPKKVEMLAIIFEQGVPVNQADKDLVTDALRLLGIKTIWE